MIPTHGAPAGLLHKVSTGFLTPGPELTLTFAFGYWSIRVLWPDNTLGGATNHDTSPLAKPVATWRIPPRMLTDAGGGVLGDWLGDLYDLRVTLVRTPGAPAEVLDLRLVGDAEATADTHHPGTAMLDWVQAGGGADTLEGGLGNDTLFGGDGTDLVDGGAGTDVLLGGVGDDTVIGGAGADTLSGAAMLWGTWPDRDLVLGGAGDDVLLGGNGAGTLAGGAGADTMAGAETVDFAWGGAHFFLGGDGDDLVLLAPTASRALGGAGDDAMRPIVLAPGPVHLVAEGRHTLDGGDGADSITGRGGDDLMLGGTGGDRLLGGLGADRLLGGAGDDHLFGDLPPPEPGGIGMVAGDLPEVGGADLLDGGEGRDSLSGGAGADRLDDGAGADTLRGGAGRDRLVLADDGESDLLVLDATKPDTDVILGFVPGLDRVVLLLPAGTTLDAARFVVGGAPRVGEAGGLWVLYDTIRGVLSVDQDGAGGTAAYGLARFDRAPVLGFDDLIAG